MTEHLTIPGALEWDAVERHSIATLRYAGGKEHDVKYVSEVAYDAALAREAALREELAALRESYEAMRDRKNSIVYLQQRLTVAEQRVQRMVECSKGQDSVATGYLSDILALLKPSEERP